MNWTPEEYADLLRKRARTAPSNEPPLRGSKYRNVKVEIHGEKFDSKREAAYWQGLKAREAAGEIRALRRQVPYGLYCPTAITDTHAQVSSYVADFVFEERDGAAWSTHVVDAKGKRTALYTLKAKWLFLQDGISIEEV